MSYYPNGAIKEFTYGNGIKHTMAQNARKLPDRSTDAYGASAVLDDSYDYDFNGNVTAISDALPGNIGNRDMTYDGLDRLTSATSTGMFNGTIQCTYDVLDNLQTVVGNGRNDRYCYHHLTRHLQFLRTGSTNCADGSATTTFTFDVQGNLAEKNQVDYKFSQDNRLRSVVDGTGAVLESYRYDGHGRRMLGWRPGINILPMYDRGGVLRYVSNGRKGIYYDYNHLGGSLVASREKSGTTGAYTTKYQHTDALGTPVAVTDAARNVIERSRYEPYGKVLNRAHDDQPGFTGHVEDSATGLTYMQQRYYDPVVGRFLSVDPVTATSVGGNFNRYWYANNNPYRFTDPDGRAPHDTCNLACKKERQLERQRKTDGVFGVFSVGRKYTGGTAPAKPESKTAGPFKSGYIPATANPTQPSLPATTKHQRKTTFFSGETSLDFQAAGPGFGVGASKGLTGTGDKASAVIGAGYQAAYNFNILRVSWSHGDAVGPGLSLGGAGVKFAYGGGIDAQFNVNEGGEEFVLNGSVGFSTAIRVGSVDYSTEE